MAEPGPVRNAKTAHMAAWMRRQVPCLNGFGLRTTKLSCRYEYVWHRALLSVATMFNRQDDFPLRMSFFKVPDSISSPWQKSSETCDVGNV